VCCRGWWQAVSAAEAPHAAAAAYRQGLRSAVRQRWLLPHLLAAATGAVGAVATTSEATTLAAAPGGGSNGGGETAHARLVQLLPMYAAALGIESGGVEAAVQQAGPRVAATGGGSSSRTSSSTAGGGVVTGGRRLQLLELGLWTLAEGVQVGGGRERYTSIIGFLLDSCTETNQLYATIPLWSFS
jgi:hypothetical protein